MHDLVEAVKAHARTHYNTGGWDFIIECFTDDEIAARLAEHGIATAEDAIEHFLQLIQLWDEHRAEMSL